MKKMTLTLNLLHKGKKITYARGQEDFGKNLYIGNDRSLLMQVLDKAFPFRHLLVSTDNGVPVLNPVKGSRVKIETGGSLLDEPALRTRGMWKNKGIVLSPDMRGLMDWGGDWQVEFAYQPAPVIALAPALLSEVRELRHYPAPDKDYKFNITFIAMAMLITLGGLLTLDQLYVPTPFAPETQYAYLITTDILRPEPVDPMPSVDPDTPMPDQPDPGEPKPAISGNDQPGTKGLSREDVKRFFPGNGLNTEPVVVNAEVLEKIATTGNGVRFGERTAAGNFADIDVAKVFQDGSASRSLTPGGNLDIAKSLAGKDIAGGIKLDRNQLLAPEQVAGKPVFSVHEAETFRKNAALIPGLRIIPDKPETVVASVSPGQSAPLESRVRQVVASKRLNLTTILDRIAMREQVSGTLKITLLVTADNKLKDMILIPTPGSRFSPEAIGALEAEIRRWSWRLNTDFVYEFTLIYSRL